MSCKCLVVIIFMLYTLVCNLQTLFIGRYGLRFILHCAYEFTRAGTGMPWERLWKTLYISIFTYDINDRHCTSFLPFKSTVNA